MDGGARPGNAGEQEVAAGMREEEFGNTSISQMEGKDPRRIARQYQIDLCQKALKENTIAYLGTGCGKTHIAILLIYEMHHLFKKPQRSICVFLAPTVALVEQQAKVIEESIDVKVGIYCGSTKRLKSHHDWEKEMEHSEVLVMTPQILLHNLSHCFIRIDQIALLIFDECHYAQAESYHPYAEIMKVFYKTTAIKLPRIFGMTASPKFGKGASINSLETLLHAKVYSVDDKQELEQFVTYPKINVYYYSTAINSTSCPLMIYYRKLEEIKHQCISMLSKSTDDYGNRRSTKKILQRLEGNLFFCLENLGLWGALQATRMLLNADQFERSELVELEGKGTDNYVCDRYLAEAATVFSSGIEKDGCKTKLTFLEVSEEPFFSRKVFQLINVLANFRLQDNMKCIVFVNRIITARSLSHILGNLTVLSSWKCDFLVGVHSGLKCVSRKNTNNMLEKFRSGELNLLVATKVGEEGLDIQTCCLVIRFDLPETLASFIQSGGRARMPQSEYAFLVNRDNQNELNLIRSYIKDEDQMNKEIECRTSSVTFNDLEEKVYKVDSTGATISAGSSISLLYCYCSKLPHDEYFNPKPEFSYFDVAEGTVCHIILPSNAAIRQIASSPQSSIETAKKDACLQACKELHQLGALTDYLLPAYEAEHEDSMQYFSDSDSSDDDESRRELHEMLVPAAFREPWNNLDSVRLNSYFIKFSPHPVDRYYKPFGLFVKLPLPGEAERMELDLQLAHGRSVMTELVPSKVVKFDKDEIVLAEKFQKMFLKVVIDRSEFVPELVSLGNNDYDNMGTKKFYLMLPVIPHECEDTMTVDWKLIRRCLSSPIFRISEHVVGNGFPDWSNQLLYLANGPRCINDVVNSLVYVPSKKLFFFVSDVVWEKNAYSQYKESRTFLEHFAMSDIQLSHPTQPLLKAKQFFNLENLLRKKGHAESRQKEEHFIELPPEICELKIIGFSKDIGSSLSLLPSVMHRLESLLVAIELKDMLSASFSEGAEVTASRVLEALTTERCSEHFSLERLEVLGDAFLKFSVGRHLFLLHGALDEGQLTKKRSNAVNNYNLFKLATRNNLQIYIRDQSFEPLLFFALGRPCSVICSKEIEKNIHLSKHSVKDLADAEVRCNKSHHWLFKKTIADVVEALVGAFIVDSGFKAATAFLNWIGIPVNFEASRVRDICSESTVYMSLGAQIDLTAVEKSVGYQFVNKGLLVQAFLHPSYNSHCGGCYQRLEFLGDAVLDYLMTSYVYSVYPKLNPGQLTDLRSMSVNNNSFAGIAINREFHKYIMCDSTDLRKSMDEYVKYFNISRTSSFDDDQVEAPRCPKALGDLVESCIGAILLDTGFDLNRVWKTMLSFLDPIMNFSRFQLSPIRELQELCQGHNLDLDFVSSNKGKYFSVEAKVDGNVSASSCAIDVSRKAAKAAAAKQLILMLKKQGYKSKYKSLEDVVKFTRKMEAKLVGYDETPTEDITPYAAEIDKFKASESSVSGGSSNVHLVSVEPKRIEASSVKPGRQAPTIHESQQIERNDTYSCHTDSPTAVNNLVGSKKTAKTRLLELCIAKCWKPPIFECCGETGPSHMKQFAFKVVLEIDEPDKCFVEITGRPLAKKKDAAANAAEGALWYLKHEGYLVQY